jgi:uncharacterized protein YycO
MKDLLQKFLLQNAGKLSRAISKVHAPWTRKLVTEEDFLAMDKLLKIGDVISTKTNGELSNPFVPGFWGHVGVYVGNGMVVQATTHGVISTHLAWFLKDKDYCAVSRPNFLSEDQCWLVADYCKQQVGKQYDFSFNTSDIEKFYCSELYYSAIKFVIGESPFKLKKILGQETVAPSDFYEATKLFVRIFKSKSYIEL